MPGIAVGATRPIAGWRLDRERAHRRRLLGRGPDLSRAWTWPVPGAFRLSIGATLLLAVAALAAAATSRRSYQRTRLATAASPVILVLDATAVTAVLLAAPALTWPLTIAVAASLTRITFTAWTLPRLAVR